VKKVKYFRRMSVVRQYGEGTLLVKKSEIFKEKECLLSGKLWRRDVSR
jgi:hypothetical protein